MFQNIKKVINKYYDIPDDISKEISKLNPTDYTHIIIPFTNEVFVEIFKIHNHNKKNLDFGNTLDVIVQDGMKYYKICVYSIDSAYDLLLNKDNWNIFNIDKLRFDVESFLYNKIEKNIPDYFQDIEVIKNGLIINIDLTPNSIFFEKAGIKYFKDLDNKLSHKIKKIKILTNNRNEIMSVYIDSSHINANPSSKEFCIGEVKYKTLNLKNINDIITKLYIYNAIDCYYIPKNIKNFIAKMEI